MAGQQIPRPSHRVILIGERGRARVEPDPGSVRVLAVGPTQRRAGPLALRHESGPHLHEVQSLCRPGDGGVGVDDIGDELVGRPVVG